MFVINDSRTLVLAVRTELDKIYSFTTGILSDAEIEFYIPKAMIRFIKQRFDHFDANEKRLNDLRRLVYTSTINSNLVGASGGMTSVTTATNGVARCWTFTIPADYMYSVSEHVMSPIGLANATSAPAATHAPGATSAPAPAGGYDVMPPIKKTLDTYAAELQNPLSDFNLHHNRFAPIRVETYKEIYYFTPKDVLSFGPLFLTYVINPQCYVTLSTQTKYVYTNINAVFNLLNDFFPMHLWDEIITMTVELLLESLGDPRVQTYAGVASTMQSANVGNPPNTTQ
jgi:hypothetical protein